MKVGRCGIATKTDTWTASIVDLSYPLTLSRFSRLDTLDAISVARFSIGRGPGMGRGGISRCESEDRDEFDKPLISASPSIVIVAGPGIGLVGGVGGIGGIWALFSFLT